jgi:hypothetical protein
LKPAKNGVASVKSADSCRLAGTIRHSLLFKYKMISSISQIMSVPTKQLTPFFLSYKHSLLYTLMYLLRRLSDLELNSNTPNV